MKAPACIALLAGICLSALVAGVIWQARERERQDAVQRTAQDRADVIRQQILRSLEVLHGMAAFFDARPTVSREEFRVFVSGSLERQPELQALAWDPVVPAGQRETWENQARADGFPGFHFTQEESGGQLVSAGRR